MSAAAYTGQAEVARLLLQKGAFVDAACLNGATPLYFAAQNGREEVVELLLASGADVNGATPFGTPLHGASCNGHAAIISALLAKGANVDTSHPTDGWTPLQEASFNGHVEAVRALLLGGARVTGKGIAALAEGGHFPVLGEALLLALAADGALRGDIRAAIMSLKMSAN